MPLTDDDVGIGDAGMSDADVGIAPAARTNPMGGKPLPTPLDTEIQQWVQQGRAQPGQPKSMWGTPLPQRPDTYGDTLSQFYDEAEQKMRGGMESLVKASDPGAGVVDKLKAPFNTAGALADIATGAFQGIIAPATAAGRHYGTAAQEYYTGIPAEKVEEAIGAVGPGKGVRLPMRDVPAGPRVGPQPAQVTPPLGRLGPTDLPQLERDIAASPPRSLVDMGRLERDLGAGDIAGPSAQEQAPLATPREGLEPNVRLLPPEVPHSLPQSARDSVGTARAEDILSQVSPETTKELTDILRSHGYNEHTLDARLEEMSPHETLAELNEDLSGHAGGIHATPGQPRTEIGQTFRQRGYEAPERIAGEFDRAFGQGVNKTEFEREVKQARAREAAPFWRRFEQLNIPPSPAIEAVMPRLEKAGALKAANKALGEEGLPTSHGFPSLEEEVGGNAAAQRTAAPPEQSVPTARAFQYAKEHLDDLIESNMRAGNANASRRYTKLKNDLVKAIDEHPDPNVAGVWREAREIWGTHTGLLKAREMGEAALKSGMHYTELPAVLEKMSAPEREAFLYGVRGHLEDIAGRPGRTELRQINEALSPSNRAKISDIIGEERAGQLFHALEAEQRMHFAPDRIIRNSVTAEKQAYRNHWQPPAERKLEGAVDLAGDVASHGVMRTAVKKGWEATVARRSAADQARYARMREDMGRLLTLQGPERDAVLRRLVQGEQEGSGGLAVNPMGHQPLKVQATQRTPGGRPMHTAPLRMGRESDVLEQGARLNPSEGPAHVITKMTETGKPKVVAVHAGREAAEARQNQILRSAWDREQEEMIDDPRDREPYPGSVEKWKQASRNAAGEVVGEEDIPGLHPTLTNVRPGQEVHVVATGTYDPEMGEAGPAQVHGVFHTEEEAKKAADKFAREQWENGRGDYLAHNEEKWAAAQEKAIQQWNKDNPKSTPFDPEMVEGKNETWFGVVDEGDGYIEKPLPRELASALDALEQQILPYPGLKKATRFWKEHGDYDALIPVISKTTVSGHNPMGRQPLQVQATQRTPGGRPMHTERLPIGNEQKILERAEQRLSEGPRIVPPREQQDILRKNWERHGPERDWDFDNWKTWDREVNEWNASHPEKLMPTGDYVFRSNPEFEKHFSDKHLIGKKSSFPGAKKANEYFQDENPEMTVYTSMRQVPDDFMPEKMRAMGGRVLAHYVDQNPSEAQKRAGNYRKGHVTIHGLDITIENARGHWREGVGKDGKVWRVKMPSHYGYIKGTVGKDRDHVDVYVGPHTRCRRTWVIDQKDTDTGRFDEHKLFVGFASEAQVRRIYKAAFSDGKGEQRIGGIREMDVGALKDWLKNGDTTKPITKVA